ncbi:hydrogenase small subunit [Nocardioides sp. GY 10127]|uniref:hydrogenase small subunit n=1 Tax=Nocardioides sp. GY 10127 TaxID=2569762 RepID=UPI0010A8D445|nr:hydrogenase small subunit [Nocardioides sp. GY 10127]TIC80208.1 Ni/Fe hydrogenase [Nocardioides sp. GY 10127]
MTLDSSPVPAAEAVVWREKTLGENLARAGVSRRSFLAFCSRMAAVFAVGAPVAGWAGSASGATPTAEEIASALEKVTKPVVVWLQLQECTGCSESLLRAGGTTVEDVVLKLLSVDYLELLMAASGDAANKALEDANASDHVLVVNGSVPTKNGAFCVIGGESAETVLRKSAENATAVLAVGACAVWGSVQASKPNPTGAVGVEEIITDKPVLNVAGCPPIGEVIVAAITYILANGDLPETDSEGRPTFAYGQRIHDTCPRRAHFDAGQFVKTFDDEGAKQGWCLYDVGCKGPSTFSPCPVVQWNLGTSWPIGSGHPCIGCTEKDFFDTFTPFYTELPDVELPGVEATANKVGLGLLGVAAGGVAIHSAATGVRRWQGNRKDAGDAPLVAFGDTDKVWLPTPQGRPGLGGRHQAPDETTEEQS